MGFRWRKSFKLMPGVRINLSHKGISSISAGVRGASINIGKSGVRATASLPGTGLSYSQQLVSPSGSTGSSILTLVVGAVIFAAVIASCATGNSKNVSTVEAPTAQAVANDGQSDPRVIEANRLKEQKTQKKHTKHHKKHTPTTPKDTQ